MMEEPELEVHSVEDSPHEDEQEDSGILDLSCIDDIKTFQENAALPLRDASFSWSDDDFSLDMRHSMIAIREEASRIDAAIQEESSRIHNDSLEQEFQTVSRQLDLRMAEIHELKAMVAQSEATVGRLELERDLYKADAEKLKKDLGRLTETIRELQLQGTSSSLDRTTATRPNHRPCPPPSAVSSDMSSSHASPIREDQTSSKTTRSKQSRRFFLRRRKTSKRPPPLSATVRSSMDFSGVTSSLPQQDLQDRFLTSLETAEELRRRLAMVSRYYEKLVRRLQDDLVQEKTRRMQADLHHISQLWTDVRPSNTM